MSRDLRVATLACAAVLWAGTIDAAVVNVDIDGRPEAHVGDDGVLSSAGGTFWNRLGIDFLNDVNLFDVDDEFGGATAIDLTFDADGSADFNARAIELYDGGGTGLLEIKSLAAGGAYDLAVYAHNPSFSVTVTGAAGSSTQSTGATFSVELPGDEGEEYLIFSGIQPFDLGGGVIGLTIQTNGATRMAGIQIEQVAAIPEPTTAALALFAAVCLLPLRRRRVASP